MSLGEPYRQRERLLSPGAQELLNTTWAMFARRLMPDMREAEAIAAFKELHAAGLVELVQVGDGVELRFVDG
jgi:hypothetical protein